MSVDVFIPALSTLVTLVSAIAVFRRYWYRRGNHLLLWGIGLALYTLATLSEAVLGLTWSPIFFRLWYWAGALVVAAWLGQGTVFLLVRKRPWPQITLVLLFISSVAGLIWIFATPLDESAFALGEGLSLTEQYKEILPSGGVRLMTPFLNIYGTLGLVGGAAYSAWLFRRKQVLSNRVWGNVLIAVGGLAPALGGSFARLGQPAFLYLSELLGGILIFVGYLVAIAHSPVRSKPRGGEERQ
jgi:hypothetical protein